MGDWWSLEQRQQTGGDNRSHALVTEVSCVTRSHDSHVTQVAPNWSVWEFLGSEGSTLLLFDCQNKISRKHKQSYRSDTGLDKCKYKQTNTAMSSLTQVWLMTVEVLRCPWHHDIRVMVTRMSWGPVSRHITRDQVSCQSVKHLDTWEPEQVFSQPWLSPDQTLILSHGSSYEFTRHSVEWHRYCPAGWRVWVFCVYFRISLLYR